MNTTKLHQLFRRRGAFALLLTATAVVIFFSVCVSVTVGQAGIPLGQSVKILLSKLSNGTLVSADSLDNNAFTNIIWQVRMPRVLFAVLIGGGLALCGTVMQAVVQNPLADPYILGVSSGSSLGATFAILVGFGSGTAMAQMGLAFGAFVGAMLASLAVLLLSSVGGRMTSVKLILSGSIVSALCGSVSSFIVYLSSNTEGMKTVTFWSMGSLATASWRKLPVLAVVVVLVCLFFAFQHRILNIMLLGDEAAVTLGVKLSGYRRLYMLLTALLTGVIVAYSGMIGFIGLIVPHLVRGVLGSDHKRLIPVATLFGALFLIWADVLSRVLLKNVELPIGIITALIGAPLFVTIIVKKSYNFGR